jgi:hypothetical protein
MVFNLSCLILLILKKGKDIMNRYKISLSCLLALGGSMYAHSPSYRSQDPAKPEAHDKYATIDVDKISEDEIQTLLNVLRKETEALAHAFKLKDIDHKNVDTPKSYSHEEVVEELQVIKDALEVLKESKLPAARKYAENVKPVLDHFLNMAHSKRCSAFDRSSKKVMDILVQIRRIVRALLEKVEVGFSETEALIEDVIVDLAALGATVNSRLDALDGDLNACCFTLESKLDNLTVSASCDVFTVESKLDACCFSLESKIDLILCIGYHIPANPCGL